MDYTQASGFVIDSEGRRQLANRDLANGVPGTDLDCADLQGVINSLMAVLGLADIPGNAADDSLVGKAILALISQSTTPLLQSRSWVTYNSSTTVSAPRWANYAEVIVVGGGGGGSLCQASSVTQNVSGGGGGGGGFGWGRYPITAGTSYAITVPAGGIAEQNGGIASFGPVVGDTLLSASGGFGSHFTSPGTSAGGTGGVVTGANIVGVIGNAGSDGQAAGASLTLYFAGNGGSGPFGGAGRASLGGGEVCNAVGPGAGAGGAYDSGLTGNIYRGGTGSPGVVIVCWQA